MITSVEPSSVLSKNSESGSTAPRSSQRKRGRKIPPSLVFASLFVLIFGIGILSLKFGSISLSAKEILQILFFGESSLAESDLPHSLLVWDLRLPRFLLSLTVGACLASAGVCIQGLFRNPLVEPGFIGVGPGAALAASAWIVYSDSIFSFLPNEMRGQGSYFLQVFAFGGALLISFLLHLISRKEGGGFSLVLVLTGIAVNATVISLLGFLSYAADDNQLRNLTFWSLGSLAGATWHKVTLLSIVLLFVSLFLPVLSRGLDALALGEADAFHTGFQVKKIRNLTILLSSLLVGISISLTGNIGFVGLIVPHILRIILGPGHRILLPASMLGGGLLVAIADLSARTIVFPSELPIGIIASGLGGTFFLVLILRSKHKEGQFR